MRPALVASVIGLVLVPWPIAAADPVRLHAAGSLRSALTEVSRAFEERENLRVEAKFGASGLLRDEIAKGVPAEVFASANVEHPLSLARDGKAVPVVLFAEPSLRPDAPWLRG